MFKLLFDSITSKEIEGEKTVKPHKALFTAMSTIIGIAVIVGPVVTIQLGGPGALVYFLLTNIFGSILSYAEVTFAVTYRKRLPDGTIMGGPMEYIKEALSSFFASWYAIACFILLLFWTSLQANTVADMLSEYYIPTWTSGILLSILILFTLVGGIKRIGNFSEKLVPIMFFLYSGSALFIVLANFSQIPKVLDLMLRSAFSPKAILGGTAVGGLVQTIRFGLLKGINSHEAGIGTGAIPHSMAEVKDPKMQGILSILSIYSHGFLCFISGLVVLLTGTWQDPTIRFGATAMTKSFGMYFSSLGPILLTLSTVLFGFGTILGNSYNGEQCYKYFLKNKHKKIYYISVAIWIFIGSVAPVKTMWIIPDFFLILVAIPHIIGILVLSFKRKDLLIIDKNK